MARRTYPKIPDYGPTYQYDKLFEDPAVVFENQKRYGLDKNRGFQAWFTQRQGELDSYWTNAGRYPKAHKVAERADYDVSRAYKSGSGLYTQWATRGGEMQNAGHKASMAAQKAAIQVFENGGSDRDMRNAAIVAAGREYARIARTEYGVKTTRPDIERYAASGGRGSNSMDGLGLRGGLPASAGGGAVAAKSPSTLPAVSLGGSKVKAEDLDKRRSGRAKAYLQKP